MRARNPFVQALLLIVLAFVVGIVANAFADRTRRLVLPGFYPNALKVPDRTPATNETNTTDRMPVTASAAPVTATTATLPPPTAAATTTAVAPAMTTTTAPPPPPVTTTTPTTTGGRAEARPALSVDLAKYQPHPDKAYVEISGDEAAALHGAGVLFLDARRTAAYEEGHVAGARSFSVWEADVDEK
ncbi:MAG TPA: hypothetical protein VM733_02740, partial [Thermoanaerobaculia bacterium]|nr:hypothetical protein [Thermoanaerobaculia bacterium]